jgi:hypothetical protein
MATPIERLLIDGEKLDARVEGNMQGGEILRTMDGASTLTLNIHDPQGTLLQSGVLAKSKSRADNFAEAAWTRLGKLQVSLDGAFYRISGVQKTGSILSLTFEDEIVALLRAHTRAIRASRHDITRAAFINDRLLTAVHERKILSWIPSLDKRQRIKKADVADTKVGQPGIKPNAHIQIKHTQADRQQIRNLNTILDEASKLNATERATLAMLCAAIAESERARDPEQRRLRLRGRVPGDPKNIPHEGHGAAGALLPRRRQGLPGRRRIKAAAQNSTWSPGRIALAVEGSLANFNGNVTAGTRFYERTARRRRTSSPRTAGPARSSTPANGTSTGRAVTAPAPTGSGRTTGRRSSGSRKRSTGGRSPRTTSSSTPPTTT